MERDTTMLLRSCSELGIALNREQIEQLLLYYEMLVKKNRVMNLTAITDWDEVVIKHFLDSLALVKGLQPEKYKTLIDVGTGAGFPGIPLKIAFPHMQVTLADSLGKRVRFLQEVIAACKLTGIEAIHGRAEDLARDKTYRESYDVCVSRAVANLSTLTEYCLPFVRIGGAFVAYKTADVGEEVFLAQKAMHTLGGKLKKDPIIFCLPETDVQRALVIIEKKRETPGKYPRKAGTPAKEPIR